MKIIRLKRFAMGIFIALLLAVSSFAAPLCACLEVTAKSHDCCDKMEGHCPLKKRMGNSLDKMPHSDCACSAEKQESTPEKISDFGRSLSNIPTLIPEFLPEIAVVDCNTVKGFFIAQVFPNDPLSDQAPARAPPRL